MPRKKIQGPRVPREYQPNEPHLQRRGKIYYVRFTQDGRDTKRSTGQASLQAALAWAQEHMPDELAAPRRLDTATGYDWRRAFQHDRRRAENKGRSDTYIDTDITARHRSLAFFQGMTRIDKGVLERFRDHNRHEGRTDESTRRAIIVLRRGCRLLQKDNIYVWICPKEHNPDLRSAPRNAKTRGRWVPEEDLRAWLTELKPRPRAVAVIGLTTGLRWSELRRLTPGFLTKTARYPGVPAFISLPEGKGKDKSGRSMALCEAAYSAFHLLWQKGDRIKYAPRTAWRSAAKRANLRAQGRPVGYIHERDMRHNFATLNGEKWADVQGLMRAMGHEHGSPSRYQTATPQRLVKFALFAAQTYGLATGPGCSRKDGVSGTLDWINDLLRMRR